MTVHRFPDRPEAKRVDDEAALILAEAREVAVRSAQVWWRAWRFWWRLGSGGGNADD
jgi:hypothetical protein